MALHGPASVLDQREIDRDGAAHIVRDRLTRHCSPARSSNRYSYTSDNGSLEEDVINPRIPQPYRTSFSAVTPPERIKRDRSRSTSPCTSSLKGSNRSRSKSPGGRRSHKHVTYDEKVVICDSKTSDNIASNLSDQERNDTSGRLTANNLMVGSDLSDSSHMDYSSEIRDLSQQIVMEYSNNAENNTPEMSSQNRKQNKANASTPNGTVKVSADSGSRNPKQNIQVYNNFNGNTKIGISEDYDNERSISYRVAITNNYSEDIKQEAEEIMKEISPEMESKPEKEPQVKETKESKTRERHSSLPNENDELQNSRLTPAKRSISSSIGNFFRRLSPHVGRRGKKGNLSTTSSQSLSPGDDLDGSFQRHNSTSSLSRGKLRRSLMKLMGKSKKSRKYQNKTEFEDLNQSTNSQGDSRKHTPKSALYMKSIEQTSKTDKDIYRKFKERKTPKSGESTPKGKAVKASRVTYTDYDKPSTTETSINSSCSEEALSCDKVLPPDTLNVKLVPKSIQSIQATQMSMLSVDDSIGECSIDPNFTGSEPSLLSETSTSKRVEVGHLSQENVTPAHTSPLASSPLQNEEKCPNTESDSYGSNRKRQKELNLSYPQMPIIADSADYFPTDTPTRTLSYLRISSAVSGYGHYSKYSAYKGIEKRSPYSSTLSLRSSRSDLNTPISPIDMPIGKLPNIQAPTNWPPLKNEILAPKSPVTKTEVDLDTVTNGANTVHTCVNGDAGSDIAINGENGHESHVGNFVSTGDISKDVEYFLGLAQVEESRLLLLCSKCEFELVSEGLSEEVCGKIRSAVGKANLLVNQKFQQFRDLCQKHQHPDLDSKATKFEDLQGFWEMVKLQVDDVDLMFAEIDMMRENGWNEIKIPSRRSSCSSRSSPKSSSLNVSNTSTPSHTPGSRRRAARVRDTPESSPDRSQKAKLAAKVRDDARKKMLAQKRAAMKQRQQEADGDVEIYVGDNVEDNGSKSDSPGRTSSSDGAEA